MDLRKPLFLEHFFSILSSKRRVVSGFGVGVVGSLLVLSFLISGNTPAIASSRSLLSWFFSVSESVSDSQSNKTSNFSPVKGGEVGVNKTQEGNSSNSSFGGNPMYFPATHLKNSTGDVKDSSDFANEEPVPEKTHDGHSSNGSFSGREPDLREIRFKNLTGDARSSSILVNGKTVSEKTHVGEYTGKGGAGSLPEGAVPSKETRAGNFSQSNTVSSPDGKGNASTDDGMTRAFKKKGGIEGKDLAIKEFGTEGKNVSLGSGEGRASERTEEAASKHNGSTKLIRGFPQKCDIFNGRWVRDERKPFYAAGSCPYIDDDFNCHKNGRPDDEFLRWRWQPSGCNIPRLNATDFLARLRGKRLIFVGDSLNRNMWESLVCILRDSIKTKSRVYEVSGRHDFKTKGYYSFRFQDYKCSVDFVRSPFLVRELYLKTPNGSVDERLRLDLLDETTLAYHEADIIVFNTGHWWTHEKTSRGIDYYQEGDHVHPLLKVMEAYKKALTTWAKWLDKNINPKKTRVVFRGYSLTHFRGGQWNSGGQCHKETEPIFEETFLAKYPSKMRVLERVVEQMKTPVIYLNISRLTDYRKDGHPSIYRKKYNSVEEQIDAEKSQDCSHWCLPGIPDTWNELLYAALLMDGKGSWKQ